MVTFDSIISDVRDRAKNPFFATLIFVWLVRNWIVVYTLFNFDDNCNSVCRVNFIKSYFHYKSFWVEFFTNIGIAIFFLLVGHLLKVITDVVATAIRHRIKPHLNKTVSSSLIANSSDLEKMREKRDSLLAERRELREENIILQEENRDLKKSLSVKDEEISNYKEQLIDSNNLNNLKEKELNKRNTSIIKKEEELRNIKSNQKKQSSEIAKKDSLIKELRQDSNNFLLELSNGYIDKNIAYQDLSFIVKKIIGKLAENDMIDNYKTLHEKFENKTIFNENLNDIENINIVQSVPIFFSELGLVTNYVSGEKEGFRITLFGTYIYKIISSIY
jgi:hypothetical protein